MTPGLREALQRELESAGRNEAAGDLSGAFAHLERAHILSQRYTLIHAAVHLRMLRIGWRRRDAREVFGQTTRSIAALLFSRLWVPLGNTGGANVSALRPMPLPVDLKALLERGDS
jgi:hypothetical protein